jgi:serine/threonine-protein kinase
MGTPFYMSPEGIQGKEMTHLSDQYSLGVVLYECATGKNPFMAGSFPEVVNLITTGKYLPPSQHVPIIPKRLCRIIERAMSLDPEKRFKDLREMGRELLLLAGQRTRITWGLSFGDLARSVALARAAAEAPGRDANGRSSGGEVNFRPRRKGVVALVALLALLGAGAAAYLFVPGLQDKLGPGAIAALDANHQAPKSETLGLRGSTPSVPEATTPAVPTPAVPTQAVPSLAEPAPTAALPEPTHDESLSAKEDDHRADVASDDAASEPAAKGKGKGKATAKSATTRTRDRERTGEREPGRRRVSVRRDADQPDWVVPADQTALAQPSVRGPRLGTNNAPILD